MIAAATIVPENTLTTEPKCLWKPSHPENTHMDKFRQLMQSKHQDIKLGMKWEFCKSSITHLTICIDNYDELWRWSVKYPELFWSEVWDYTNIISSKKGGHVVDKSLDMDTIPEWFNESRLNFAENLLWCRRSDKTAIIATGMSAKKITFLYEINIKL
jgi:acetoacetyl-CoA synthetase